MANQVWREAMAREPRANCCRRAGSSRIAANSTASAAASPLGANAASSAPTSTSPIEGGGVLTTGTPCATAFMKDPRRADSPSRNGSAITSQATNHREMLSDGCSPVSTRRTPANVLAGTGGSDRRTSVVGEAAPMRASSDRGPLNSGRRRASANTPTPLLACRKPKNPMMKSVASRPSRSRAADRFPLSADGSMVGPAGIHLLFASP